jgi:hypothetical protein
VNGGAGKINVGTVDPPYTINGKKYATYLPGMVGQKEEATGIVVLEKDGANFKKVIKFQNEEIGSDLWLFAKTTALKNHIGQMSVLLTPQFDGRTWCSVDEKNMMLTIFGKPENGAEDLKVSYRLTAPRFDASKWGNTRDNNDKDEPTGFIIND